MSENTKFTLTLDASQIYTFMTCPLQWYYQYHENLRLSGTQMVAADKGTLIHHLCDLYYNFRWLDPNGNKQDHLAETIKIFINTQATKKLFPNDNGDLERFLWERFNLYVNRYITNDFVLPQTKVSPVELGFSKLIYEDKYVRFILEGRIDLVNLINGDIWCFTDHKTQDRKGTLYSYTPQFKTYALATGYRYAQINYIGMQQDKDNKLLKAGKIFHRQLINFPDWMINEWETKVLKVFNQITELLVPGHEEKEFYTERNDGACGGAFHKYPCAYTHICEQDWNMKQAVKEFKYKVVEKWSPWSLIKGA